jgi:hypothetical protein
LINVGTRASAGCRIISQATGLTCGYDDVLAGISPQFRRLLHEYRTVLGRKVSDPASREKQKGKKSLHRYKNKEIDILLAKLKSNRYEKDDDAFDPDSDGRIILAGIYD